MATPAQNYTKPAYKITPQVLADLEQYARDGMTKAEIADCLGIHVTTFISKVKEYPNVAQAYEKGRREGLIEIASKIRRVKESLFRNADDHEVIIKDEAVTVPGDVKAQIFIMKAKAGWQDVKPQETQINIVIPPLFAPQHMQDLEAMFKEKNVTIDA